MEISVAQKHQGHRLIFKQDRVTQRDNRSRLMLPLALLVFYAFHMTLRIQVPMVTPSKSPPMLC